MTWSPKSVCRRKSISFSVRSAKNCYLLHVHFSKWGRDKPIYWKQKIILIKSFSFQVGASTIQRTSINIPLPEQLNSQTTLSPETRLLTPSRTSWRVAEMLPRSPGDETGAVTQLTCAHLCWFKDSLGQSCSQMSIITRLVGTTVQSINQLQDPSGMAGLLYFEICGIKSVCR